jgi:hypothetical protein
MNPLRGVVLIIAGCFALYEGWKLHDVGRPALWAYVLAVLAIALGVWRLTRPSDRPRP